MDTIKIFDLVIQNQDRVIYFHPVCLHSPSSVKIGSSQKDYDARGSLVNSARPSWHICFDVVPPAHVNDAILTSTICIRGRLYGTSLGICVALFLLFNSSHTKPSSAHTQPPNTFLPPPKQPHCSSNIIHCFSHSPPLLCIASARLHTTFRNPKITRKPFAGQTQSN